MFERLRGLFNTMFNRYTITRVLNAVPEMTTPMIAKIEQWNDMLTGNAPWCVGSDYVTSLGIEQGICREFADVVLSEMGVEITSDKLQGLFDASIEDINQNFQDGLAGGSFALKPILETGATEFVSADLMVPIRFGLDKKPADIAFLDIRHVDDNKYYIRLERHTLVGGALEITNTAYQSSTRYGFGQVVPLSVLPEWENIAEGRRYPGMTEMDFGYYRNPIKNKIDGTACGVSIFNSAIELIRKADIQGARLDWEFESGERAIHVDSRMLQSQGQGHRTMAKLNKRLYRGLKVGDAEAEFVKEFSPDLRDENIVNGLERYYRQIEFNVGLAYGDLSNTQDVDKTATEIKQAKFRKYNRVAAIEKNLTTCFEDYVKGLAFYNHLYNTGYEVNCNFRDNVLTDEEAERQQDRKDLAAGIMQPWEYRAKWYGEDEATAKAMVAAPEEGVIDE